MKHAITPGAFADLCLSAAEDVLEQHALGVPGMRAPVRSGRTIPRRRAAVMEAADELPIHKPGLAASLRTLTGLLEQVLRQPSAAELVDLWSRLAEVLGALEGAGNDRMAPFEAHFEAKAVGIAQIELSFASPGGTGATAPATGLAPHEVAVRFLRRVMGMVRAYRQAGTRRLYPADRLALLRAYQWVEAGVLPPQVMVPIRTDAQRPRPTYLSLADPGIGHLMATCWAADVLEGTIVHIETIDRGGIDDRALIEAYRIPSIRDVARIRVLVGDDAPCSVYVGRPVFEGLGQPSAATDRAFEHALLKVAHTVAAACSGLFALGVAECKIGMDGLTYKQALRYMQALTGNTIRDRFRQRFSAAFNINTPLLDDRDGQREPRRITQPMEVARVAAQLAQQGGFEKVTWDGASNEPGGKPFIGQLSAADLLTLVHDAHGRGLETYISAGMGPDEMLVAATVGVGGVGIGTWLHATLENGTVTHLKMDQVRKTLEACELGAQGVPGRAAATLAQLDWLKASGNLPEAEEALRHGLHDGLAAFHRAGSNIDRVHAEAVLTARLKPSEEFLDGLRRAAAEAAAQPHRSRGAAGWGGLGDGDDGREDPVLELARAKLAALTAARQHDDEFATLVSAGHDDDEDLALMRALSPLIEAGDVEGLRYWLGV